MTLPTRRKTFILIVISQIPMLLLLVIFFKIPFLAPKYRIMAVATIVLEAALMSELIGNIVQKVRADGKHVCVREIFERKRIPWEKVDAVEQVLVSPMRKGATQVPTKILILKTKHAVRLPLAEEWWLEHGPVHNGRLGMLDLVEHYDDYVRKHLKGCFLLWKQEYRRPQEPDDDVDEEYAMIDEREQATLNDLLTHGGKHARGLAKVRDHTYPSFFREHGGKYKQDREHLWGTITHSF